MVIKLHRNRKLLKNAAKNREWPKFTKKVGFTDPDFHFKRKRKSVKKDTGKGM